MIELKLTSATYERKVDFSVSFYVITQVSRSEDDNERKMGTWTCAEKGFGKGPYGQYYVTMGREKSHHASHFERRHYYQWRLMHAPRVTPLQAVFQDYGSTRPFMVLHDFERLLQKDSKQSGIVVIENRSVELVWEVVSQTG